MNMLYLFPAALVLLGIFLIVGFVKHLREESDAFYDRIERESRENDELIVRLHREAQSQETPKPRARAYPIAARSAAPKTAQQNSTPVQSAALDPLVENPVPDFSVPLSLAHFGLTPVLYPPAEACNAHSFAHDSSPSTSYSCDSSSSYDSSSSCDSGSSSCGGGGE